MASRWRRACVALLLASVATACSGGDGGDGEGPSADRSASGPDSSPDSSPAGGPAGGTVPVVVDTDLALDDLVALAFLLSSTEVDVLAVTVSGTGEVRCPQGLTVMRGLLAVTGDEAIPVACGRSTPLAGDHAFPSAWRDLADSGWGMDLSAVTAPADDPPATELLGTTLGRGGVTLLTLGPLTNVAETFRTDPDLAAQVASIVVMGGALDVPGNVTGEDLEFSRAEWNMYVDPTAAAEVLESGAPIVLVGLDAANSLPITGEFLELLGANAHTGPAKLVDALVRNNPQVYSGEAYFWDPLAAAVVVEPRLVATEKARIAVLTTPGRDNGRTVRRPDGTPVTIALRPRGPAFEELLLRTLDQVDAPGALATPPPPVGSARIRFDGSTCRYDGPATVPSGRMRFTFRTSDPAWTGGVVGLTGSRSVEQILSWLEAHPGSREAVPGVEQVTPVPPGVPTYVSVVSPRMAVICASDEPLPLLAGTVTVR